MEQSIRNILLNYITGKASAKETTLAKKWIAASERNKVEYVELYEAWHKALAAQHSFIDADKAYDRFITENSNKKGRQINLGAILAYAATIVVVCAAGLFFYLKNFEKAQQWSEIIVAKGQVKEVTLPDGTLVFINAGSSLKYNNDFGKKQRNVQLEGEARFDIAKSKHNIPFIVDAAGFIIRDIGTIFNIKAYAEDHTFESAVIEGEISVEGTLSGEDNRKSKVFVSANQVLRINQKELSDDTPVKKIPSIKSAKPLQLIDMNPEDQKDYTDWVSNVLSFDDTSFDDVSRALDRKFNVSIILEDIDLAGYHYTGTFKNADDVYQILDIIKQTTPITYYANGQTITIKKKTN